MVKFLKPNKAVIVLQGRYAGRKAVIVKSFDEGTRDRRYGHCLVAGIKKYPSKVIRKDSAKKTAKKSRVKCFVKLVNYQHLMPTRYTLDVDLKDVVTVDALQTKDKKVAACKATKERFEERFKTGKNRWFFTKLRILVIFLDCCLLDGDELICLYGTAETWCARSSYQFSRVALAAMYLY
ncbi:hypothetical protein V6N11_051269 [Hibiscus sabdariffa]|uniref:Uncharacterized protein n=2 Tax=Hibiscus sabdariffa TaxID=183260 RepID=A0ABR2CGC0_9ROSI